MFLKEKANSVSQNLLSKRIVDINKKFFYIKNNYKEEIKELQDSLGVSLNFVEFIEEQYKIIRELDELVKELSYELTFRRLIIERKEHVLKDLNAKVINNFIDKVYKQEMTIEELKRENKVLQRINNNLIPKEIIMNSSTGDTISNNSRNNTLMTPINVIAPKNSNEYSGTIAFFNNPVKNIQKFINIKNVNVNSDDVDNVKVSQTLNPVYHPVRQLKIKSTSLPALKSKNKNNINVNMKRFSLKSRRVNSQGNVSRNEDTYNRTMGTLCPNLSWIDNPTLLLNSSTSSVGRKMISKPKPTRITKELLGKSYEVVKRYQQKKK